MDSVSTSTQPALHFLNVEYWFRLIYELTFGGGHITSTDLTVFLSKLWLWVTFVGYGVSILAIAVITYIVVRLFELRASEEAVYGPLPELAHNEEAHHSRWHHIETLMESQNENDWRTAIIEADIYLGDILTREGYHGASIGDQLKQADPTTMPSIDDAWEAHKVRNEIAHQGTAYQLSESLARRTIAKYENVFRDLQAL